MKRQPIFLAPNTGRDYPMDRIREGPGAHAHEEDDVFFVPSIAEWFTQHPPQNAR